MGQANRSNNTPAGMRRIPKRSFFSSFLLGLSGAGLTMPGPRVPLGTIDDDWKAVGQDLRTAMGQYRRKTS